MRVGKVPTAYLSKFVSLHHISDPEHQIFKIVDYTPHILMSIMADKQTFVEYLLVWSSKIVKTNARDVFCCSTL